MVAGTPEELRDADVFHTYWVRHPNSATSCAGYGWFSPLDKPKVEVFNFSPVIIESAYAEVSDLGVSWS